MVYIFTLGKKTLCKYLFISLNAVKCVQCVSMYYGGETSYENYLILFLSTPMILKCANSKDVLNYLFLYDDKEKWPTSFRVQINV